MKQQDLYSDQERQPSVDAWFDEMVANLRYDQALIENDIIEDDKRKVYNALISGDLDFTHGYARNASSAYFIAKMVNAYLKELVKSGSKPTKLALELSDSKILVWAEIANDDEVMEDALILTEAKTNARFSQYGFYISSTIVEACDSLSVPEHYRNVAIA